MTTCDCLKLINLQYYRRLIDRMRSGSPEEQAQSYEVEKEYKKIIYGDFDHHEAIRDYTAPRNITDLVPKTKKTGQVRGETTKTVDDFIAQLKASGGYSNIPLTLKRIRVQLTKTPERYRIMVYRNNYQYAWPSTFTYDQVFDAEGNKIGPCIECLEVTNRVITGEK